MANEEHLALVKQGVEVWNKWKNENSDIIADFSGNIVHIWYIREAEFRGINVGNSNSYVSTRDAKFLPTNLNKINLEGANLSRANLSEIDFRGANLSRANLSGANLNDADLTKANLSNADLSGALINGTNLTKANLSNANLSGAGIDFTDFTGTQLNRTKFARVKFNSEGIHLPKGYPSNFVFKFNLGRADLSEANLRGFDLSDASLFGVSLKEADLSEANLMGADLSRTDLRGANLTRTQALSTNFTYAKFTGICLEDWNINRDTNLNNVICDYVYLQNNQQERRPISRDFAPREFTKLFQKALKTVDLVFLDGIDWQAFLASFLKLRIVSGSDEISIQSFENKNDAFIIRVNIPATADKAEIEKYLKREYELKAQLEARNQQLADFRQHYAGLEEIAKLLASRSINIEARAVATSESMSEAYKSKYDQRGAQIGSQVDSAQSGSRQQSINKQYNYAPEQRQNLVEAAAEIQQLLEQLSQAYPTSTNAEKMAVVAEAADRIERNPPLKARVINALKVGGTEAFKEVIDHPLVNILVATIEGWQDAE
ncbi:pentapeptide repeat-containing protein [Coleofasciculus sp. FACHB-T130]|uniref:pentapeptide repeat-containing protein n=1 Tax=Cyanophyceae TaxID=3028117 RepID=UPI001689570C|nr:pentapeptide repeat-containing protein [Coleofasciculus sp. FACHB-T130]MBD1878891.1 pentapeptide repeat-containing protein [Coleofasciculus sp. FACHB-T130]